MSYLTRAAAMWISFTVSLVPSPQCAAQPTEDDFRQHVVTIYSQDKALLGAGTAISFSGLIITAKHILEDASEAGSRAPNYRLNFFVGTHQSIELRPAEVVLVHPFMDLAILADKSGRPIPPLRLARPEQAALNTQVTMIGHRQSGPAPELYIVRSGSIDKLDYHGHIHVGRGVDKGFSGGPLIQNGYLLGVIRNSTIDQATVVPINNGARDYLRLHGIPIDDEGLARRVDDISQLASRVSLYESILLDIQSDVSWRARLAPKWADANPGSTLEGLEVHVWYEKKLSSQPEFDARLSLNAVPVLESRSQKPAAKRVSFSRVDWLRRSHGPAKFDNFDRDLKSQGMRLQDIVGFDIELGVSSLVAEASSDSKGFLKAPGDLPRPICFQLRYDRESKRFQQPIEGDGVPCPPKKPSP